MGQTVARQARGRLPTVPIDRACTRFTPVWQCRCRTFCYPKSMPISGAGRMSSMSGAAVAAEEAAQIAVEAFVYFYPLVTMEITRRQATTGPADAKPGHGPMGRFHH